MSAKADRGPGPLPGRLSGRAGGVRALTLALAVVWFAAAALAQGGDDARRAASWDALATYADGRVADEATPTPDLEALRERLVRQRSEALAAEQAQAPTVTELSSRIQALGPAPAEGAEEAPEIAERRAALNQQMAEAMVPVLQAQEAFQRADALVKEIDRIVRARVTAELRSQGPSPLLPRNWITAFAELRAAAEDYRTDLRQSLGEPGRKATVLRRLPINVLLVVAGVVITFILRRWAVDWVEAKLAVATNPRSIAWLVALRNLRLLIVPAIGAGLLFAALNPENLLGLTPKPALFDLPTFIVVLVWAGWLASSLFAPRLPAYRLISLEDADAEKAFGLTMLLGVALALQVLLSSLAAAIELGPEALATLHLPLIVLGALGLWWTSRLIALVEARLARNLGGASDQATALIGVRFLRLVVGLLRIVSVLAPLLAALGYLAAARFLVFPSILTLGLAGSGLVIFALLSALAASLFARPGDDREGAGQRGGLVPVVAAALVVLGSLPLLALIWGVRPSELGEVWTLLRDGVSFGGMRISASVILRFVAVLGVGVAITRLIQILLRGSILPRTKLDTGGRSAVVAGIGYLGFFLAGLAAVTAAGLDLTSLAFVAGALSVGIGFGLQNIVSNFVSGLILLIERPIKEGDWIEVGAYSGYVRGIRVRSTEIETFDRASVILPNSDLIAGTVLNRTHQGMSGRLQVPVSVTYDADPKKVESILLAIAEGHPLVLQDPSPRVLFMEFGPDSMNFELRCWLRDVNYSLSVRSDLNFEIIRRFQAEAVRIQLYGRDLPPTAPPEPVPVALQRAMKES